MRNGQTAAAKKLSKPSKPPAPVLVKAGGVRIEYTALGELIKAPRNPKKHDLSGIKASIGRFGYVAPMVLDEKTGRMVAGHGRLESLIELKADVAAGKKGPDGKPLARPANIQERNGEWYAPVLRGHSFKSEREAEAYLIADNRHVETGGWDDAMLRDILLKYREDPNIDALGYTKRELDIYLKPPPVAVPGEPPEKKMIGFMASEIKQITLVLPSAEYEDVLNRLGKVMEKAKLKSHTEAVLHLLTFYETRSR